MSKKKIFGITLFVVLALFMVTFANPLTKEEANKTNSSKENVTEMKQNNVSKNKENSDTTLAGGNNSPVSFSVEQENKKNELKNYADDSNIQSEELNSIINNTNDNIDNSSSTEEIDNSLNNGKKEIDNLKLQNEKDNIKKQLDNYIEQQELNDNYKKEINKVVELSDEKLNSENNIDNLANILEENKKQIDEIKAISLVGPMISLNGDPTITLELGDNYEEQGGQVTDNRDKDIKLVSSKLDTKRLGFQRVFYKATDLDGNMTTAERIVEIKDTTKPAFENINTSHSNTDTKVSASDLGGISKIIVKNQDTNKTFEIKNNDTLTDEATYYITAYDNSGNSSSIWLAIDKTAPVIDQEEGNYNKDLVVTISDKFLHKGLVTINGEKINNKDIKVGSKNENGAYVATLSDGTYVIEATDKVGNKTTKTFIIDKENPEIELNGEQEIEIPVGEEYVELNSTATDNVDGKWVVEPNAVHYRDKDGKLQYGINTVDTSKLGEYKINYSCTDKAGNTCYDANKSIHPYAMRIVRVVDKIAPTIKLPYITKNIALGSLFDKPEVEISDNYKEPTLTKSECNVDTSKVGNYTCEYEATDFAGNVSTSTININVIDVKLYNLYAVDNDYTKGLNPDAYIYGLSKDLFESINLDVYSGDTKILETLSTSLLNDLVKTNINSKEYELTTGIDFLNKDEYWKTNILVNNLREMKPTKLIYNIKTSTGDIITKEVSLNVDNNLWESILDNNIIENQKINYAVKLDYVVDTNTFKTSNTGFDWGFSVNSSDGSKVNSKKISNFKIKLYSGTTLVLSATGTNKLKELLKNNTIPGSGNAPLNGTDDYWSKKVYVQTYEPVSITSATMTMTLVDGTNITTKLDKLNINRIVKEKIDYDVNVNTVLEGTDPLIANNNFDGLYWDFDITNNNGDDISPDKIQSFTVSFYDESNQMVLKAIPSTLLLNELKNNKNFGTKVKNGRNFTGVYYINGNDDYWTTSLINKSYDSLHITKANIVVRLINGESISKEQSLDINMPLKKKPEYSISEIDNTFDTSAWGYEGLYNEVTIKNDNKLQTINNSFIKSITLNYYDINNKKVVTTSSTKKFTLENKNNKDFGKNTSDTLRYSVVSMLTSTDDYWTTNVRTKSLEPINIVKVEAIVTLSTNEKLSYTKDINVTRVLNFES